MSTLRERLFTIAKGVFASPDGSAMSAPIGTLQNTNAAPLMDLTGYLSAMPPLPPQGPSGYEIRRYDFRLGSNLDFTPGGGKYPILRAFADQWNVLRTIIDTKKDLLSAVTWSIKAEPMAGETKRQANDRSQKDPVVKQLTEFFSCPDSEHTWEQWLHLFLEEVYVVDAGCIETVRDKKNRIFKLEIVSGDTIFRVIDDRGWTPGKNKDGKWQTAYQQVVSGSGSGGVPQRNLTQEDLLFAMRNPRANQRWGQSSVEKIYNYALTGIYADQFVKAYYQSGNQPPGFVFLSDMTPEQVEEYDKKFNAAYAGNLVTKRQIAFLPSGNGSSDQKAQYVPTKEPLLKSDIYDQLVRFACAEFSVPSVPFEKPMNRASAQESGEQAQSSGIEPDIAWLQGIMNRIIKSPMYFGLDGYSFVFGPRRDIDPVKQMQVDTGYLAHAAVTVDEVRDDLGKEPFAPKIKEASVPGVMTPNNGFIPLEAAAAQPLLAARQSQTQGAQPESAKPAAKPTQKAADGHTNTATIDPDDLTHASAHGKGHTQATLEHAFTRMREKTKTELAKGFKKKGKK